jgi:ubiquinone/menaquinone biosynthesis C-methylase UbiE
MNIDFHAEENKSTYSGRTADPSWSQAMVNVVDPTGKAVIDIGCGGGIYSRAWLELGAGSVVGVDFSQVMLKTAREVSQGVANLSFVHADALNTGLPAGSADIVFARALIHHLDQLDVFFAEVHRLLKPGGICIIQDRTLEDILLPGSPKHIRGYFFECYPRLHELEKGRRPDHEQVIRAQQHNGFFQLKSFTLWEVRRQYQAWEQLESDLLARMGRSILHALTDEELEALVAFIGGKLSDQETIVEQDRWSIWIGMKV